MSNQIQADTWVASDGSSAPTASAGMKFPTTGGTPAALSYYEEYTHTIAVGDLTVETGAGTFSAVSGTLRIYRVGKIVTVFLDNFRFTSASSVTGIFLTGAAAIPTRFLPSADIFNGQLSAVPFGGTGIFLIFWITAATGVITLRTRDDAGGNQAIANGAYVCTPSFTYCLA